MLDADFCSQMKPSFRERSIGCKDIIASVERSMLLWTSRHPAIYFTHLLESNSTGIAELVISATHQGATVPGITKVIHCHSRIYFYNTRV